MMIKSINAPAVMDAMAESGTDLDGLASRVGAGRETVGEWMRGESVPPPDKLVRLGMILGLDFDHLVELTEPEPASAPVVRFRRKASGKT